MKEAMFYTKQERGKVACGLCRFRCSIVDGERGICGVRENRGGVLYTLAYGKVIAGQTDPIEKKPLFHFHPGSRTYSVATAGCNFRCLHCQNFSISQPNAERIFPAGEEMSPSDIVRNALASGCSSISYTYTEPTIFYEYAYDIAVLARAAGLGNVFVTNGYITAEALTGISPVLDAANIDLKGFSDKFYREVVHAMLGEVLESIVEYKRLGIWIEITTLIIPGYNDDDQELRSLARFIADKVGVDTPWHVSQFHPTYKLTNAPRTSVETLRRARQIGLDAGLCYVYEGNVPGMGEENTYCPGCCELLVRRSGYLVEEIRTGSGKCPSCGRVVDGVGMP